MTGSAPAVASQRLFLALWPPDRVRTALVGLIASLGEFRGRRIAGSSLHLTLAFLGSVEPAHRSCLEHGCARIRAAPFEFVLNQVQTRRRTGILWASSLPAPSSFDPLVRQVRSVLAECAFSPETRQFRAHVTLARNVAQRVGPIDFQPIRWKVNDFCLVRSELGPQGSNYVIEHRWHLVK